MSATRCVLVYPAEPIVPVKAEHAIKRLPQGTEVVLSPDYLAACRDAVAMAKMALSSRRRELSLYYPKFNAAEIEERMKEDSLCQAAQRVIEAYGEEG